MRWPRVFQQAAPDETDRPSPQTSLRRVHQWQLRCASRIDGHMIGGYDSIFKGEGIEFEETRPYQPGDDVRAIDWRVTARFDRPFVKQFRQQRQLTVQVLVDGSASMRLPIGETLSSQDSPRGSVRSPLDIAREVSGLLILIAAGQQDQVGLTLFTDRLEHAVAPQSGDNHAFRLIGDLVRWNPCGQGTDLSLPVRRVRQVAKQRSLILLASDFLSLSDNRPLRALTRAHEVMPIWIHHATNEGVPKCGLLRVIDPESRRTVWLDTNSRRQRARFDAAAAEHRRHVHEMFAGLGVLPLEIGCRDDVVTRLHRYLDQRRQLA